MKQAIFNTLHDGTLEAVAGHIPGEVLLTIECRYLRERMPTGGEGFIIKLFECTQLKFKEYAPPSREIDQFERIAKLELEILSADEKDGTIVVFCGNGELHLRFEKSSIWLNEQTQITQEELESVAQKYWDEWQTKRD